MFAKLQTRIKSILRNIIPNRQAEIVYSYIEKLHRTSDEGHVEYLAIKICR